jgi:hypothetical protein
VAKGPLCTLPDATSGNQMFEQLDLADTSTPVAPTPKGLGTTSGFIL